MDHTKGPWKEFVDSLGYVYIVGPNHKVEQDLEIALHTGTICYIGDMEETDGIDHANARLIASAPSLLEACREAVEVLERYDTMLAAMAREVCGNAIKAATEGYGDVT